MVEESGVIAKRNRRALDSTVLDDAVQRQDTISLLQSQIRRVRKLVPELADGVYVHEHNLGSGRPPCDFEDQDDIDRLVSELVDDAYELVFAAEDLGLELDRAQQEAVALLALLAGQDVEQGERPRHLAHRRTDGPGPGHLETSIPSPAMPTRHSTPTGTATRRNADIGITPSMPRLP